MQPMWNHKCIVEGQMMVGCGEECTWCGEREPPKQKVYDAFRWLGDMDAFEKWYGERMPVDFGGQISVPTGRAQGLFLRVWCGSWILRDNKNICHVCTDDVYKLLTEGK